MPPLNLIADPWIPVLHRDGTTSTIAPWQMVGRHLLRPAWPRADLDLACWELLIGFVFLADPPRDADDWEGRREPDPDRLRDRLARYAPAFDLLGDGPRFLQETVARDGTASGPDMLLIESQLWGGGLSVDDMLYLFGSVEDGNTVLRFDGGETLRLENVTDFDLLAASIAYI